MEIEKEAVRAYVIEALVNLKPDKIGQTCTTQFTSMQPLMQPKYYIDVEADNTIIIASQS